jgi:hypothetical protein
MQGPRLVTEKWTEYSVVESGGEFTFCLKKASATQFQVVFVVGFGCSSFSFSFIRED